MLTGAICFRTRISGTIPWFFPIGSIDEGVMEMTTEITCRRCSVLRVNALCKLYDVGYRDDDSKAQKLLHFFVGLAKERGYAGGAKILMPALTDDFVRKTSWNISSLLTNQDFAFKGISIDGRGKTSR